MEKSCKEVKEKPLGKLNDFILEGDEDSDSM